MSRFDIDDDGDGPPIEFWQHNLQRALRSAKGQAKLREFRDALIAMPMHRLIDDWIADANGDVCAIGAFAAYKRVQGGKTWAEATADLNQECHPVVEPVQWRDGSWHAWEPDQANAWETQDLGIRECGLNRTLAWYLGYQNDEGDFWASTPEERWERAYAWVCSLLGEYAPTGEPASES